DAGLSGKYGLTSSVTLEGTVNPDFSQVESDAFQVEVNQRFPLFFSEKRPFFMEGLGSFELAGVGGDAVMRTAVHTRRIVDPFWGLKTPGTAGRVPFGALAAGGDGDQERAERPGPLRVRVQALRPSDPDGALRPRLPDGHRLPEPGRHDAGLHVRRPELLSRRQEVPVVQARHTLLLRAVRQGPHPGRQALDHGPRRTHELHAAGLLPA